ncbi:hypothetical protein [Citrobacter farmeri]|uniref:hypothetical protein n=1 Tax=Citrobacter farmeri TaxID=67824 RepID=UPI0019000339|nr:hypothetical protein [Citrobacter farmeri]MBJ9134414.1 hypothetical protein [Citrobacter farmeri]
MNISHLKREHKNITIIGFMYDIDDYECFYVANKKVTDFEPKQYINLEEDGYFQQYLINPHLDKLISFSQEFLS